VTAADGSGAWRAYVVESVGRGEVGLHATGTVVHEPAIQPPLCVAFALTKGEKPETVVRQLTELGVDAVVPVVAEHSVVRVTGERAEALVGRLRRVAREAAAQSRRARIPAIDPPGRLADLLGAPGLVVAERGAPEPAPDAAAAGPGGWMLVVGPEGGFSPAEADALVGAPRVTVGPHVLRAETAAVAAAAVLAARRAAR
jgi:16S rRNA (uracil1498-N3)-methyltransferase